MNFIKWAKLLVKVSLTIITSIGFGLSQSDSFPTTPSLLQLTELVKSSWVASVSIGPAWEKAGKTQTFYIAPNIEKSFVAEKESDALVDMEIFLGIQKSLHETLNSQLGFAVTATSSAFLSGFILDDANPIFNNYTYKYRIRHSHLALKGKLLADLGYNLIPWVSGSIGVGFNRAYQFNNEPTISSVVAMPNFVNNTTSSFTYTIGLGVQRQLNTHWQAGIGYEFADWGRSHLNRAPGQTLNKGLELSHLYTNGLLINLTYLA